MFRLLVHLTQLSQKLSLNVLWYASIFVEMRCDDFKSIVCCSVYLRKTAFDSIVRDAYLDVFLTLENIDVAGLADVVSVACTGRTTSARFVIRRAAFKFTVGRANNQYLCVVFDVLNKCVVILVTVNRFECCYNLLS